MKNKSVLIVEDDPGVRGLLSDLLGDNYDVRVVGTAESAAEAVRISPPNLVLCDANLPNITGDDFTRELQRTPATRSIPVVMMSGMLEETAERAFAAGAVAFLPKPFVLRAVLTCVNTFAAAFRTPGTCAST